MDFVDLRRQCHLQELHFKSVVVVVSHQVHLVPGMLLVLVVQVVVYLASVSVAVFYHNQAWEVMVVIVLEVALVVVVVVCGNQGHKVGRSCKNAYPPHHMGRRVHLVDHR